MKINNHRLLNIFIKAIDNEIAVDEFHLQKQKMPPLPRVSKWQEKKYANIVLNMIYIVLTLSFILGGFLFFSLLSVLCDNIAYRKSRRNKEMNRFETPKRYYMALTDLGFNKVKSIKELQDGLCVITVPWGATQELENNDKKSIFEILTPYDYFTLATLIIASYFHFIKTPKKLKWFLQLYCAPRWFLTALAINKLSGPFITSEHYDRWAIMIDGICNYRNKHLTLVQHGSLKGLLTESYTNLRIPNKLDVIKNIYVYDKIELALFLKHIINTKCSSPNVEYIPLTLDLKSINKKIFSILIVGHILCEDDQLHLGQLIRTSISDCMLYYKEHPKARASKAVKQGDFYFIKDDDYFPDVHVVISYPSTLAYQYQEHQKVVLFHDLHGIANSDQHKLVNAVLNLWRIYEQ